jgi:hypothetical protein
MRRSGIRKKSKTPLAKAKVRLWQTLKAVIDIRDGNNCISCGVSGLVGHNKHGGHFIPSSSCGGFLRYDLRNVHNQCATCNLFRNGAGAEYTVNLQKKYGKKFVEKIIEDKQVTIKLDLEYVTKMTEYYESLLDKTQKELIKLTKNYEGFRIH